MSYKRLAPVSEQQVIFNDIASTQKLEVVEACDRKDVGKGIARVDYDVMRSLEMTKGGIHIVTNVRFAAEAEAGPPPEVASASKLPQPSSPQPSIQTPDPLWRFTTPAFYYATGPHDIFQPVGRYESGSIPVNILANLYFSIPLMLSARHLHYRIDVEGWHFASMMVGIGEVNALTELSAASRLSSETRIIQEGTSALSACAKLAAAESAVSTNIIDANVLAKASAGD